MAIPVVLAPFGGSPAQATQYTITDLGTLGGSSSVAFAINDVGQVVGWSYTASGQKRAFRWSPGEGMINLGTLGGTRSVAWGINNLGQVTGQSYNSGNSWRAFLWDETAGMIDLGRPSGYNGTVGRAVNDAGLVVGVAWQSHDTATRAYLRDSSGWTDLGSLGGPYSFAKTINQLGHVSGWARMASGTAPHAFVWSGSEMTDLGTLGGISSEARAINDLGQVVGASDGRAFRWEDGVMHDLGTLGGPSAAANDVNNAGQIVGTADIDDDGTPRAFLWENGVMTDLNELIESRAGWEPLRGAVGINDLGYIAGSELINGQTHAYLLVPVDEFEDCNSNAIPDEDDIAGGTSSDCQSNGTPDECERDTDNDGFIDDCDACPDSDVDQTIVVNGCDTGVANQMLGDEGCTMADLVAQCAGGAATHGAFVSCVAELTTQWMEAGMISGREKGRILRCAAIAEVPSFSPNPPSSVGSALQPVGDTLESVSPVAGSQPELIDGAQTDNAARVR